MLLDFLGAIGPQSGLRVSIEEFLEQIPTFLAHEDRDFQLLLLDVFKELLLVIVVIGGQSSQHFIQ